MKNKYDFERMYYLLSKTQNLSPSVINLTQPKS